MPRFPVAFGRRKSTADNLENAPITQPSFRVLDRSQVGGGQSSFDGGARLAARARTYSKASMSDITVEDNIFADLKTNRYVPVPPFATHYFRMVSYTPFMPWRSRCVVLWQAEST